MARTSRLLLLQFGLAAGLAGWLIDYFSLRVLDRFLGLGWGSPIGVAVVGLALFAWTWSIKDRLPRTERRPDGQVLVHRSANPLPPIVAARAAALAMAASRTGALLFGGYGGLAVFALAHRQIAVANHHLAMAGLTMIAAAGMVLVALWLERLCSLPKPPLEEPDHAEPNQAG